MRRGGGCSALATPVSAQGGLTSGCYSPCRVLCWLVKHLASLSHCTQKTAHPYSHLPGQALAPFHLKNVFLLLLFSMSAARKGGGIQRGGQLAREKCSATQNVSTAQLISLPSSLQPPEPISLPPVAGSHSPRDASPTRGFLSQAQLL